MVAIDTSSIRMTRNEIKTALKSMALETRTTQELNDMCTMFENKYVRISDYLVTNPGVSEQSIALDTKNNRIKLYYFLIKQWLAGERP